MNRELFELLPRVLPLTDGARITQIGYDGDDFIVSGLVYKISGVLHKSFERESSKLSAHQKIEARHLVEDIRKAFDTWIEESAQVFSDIRDYGMDLSIEYKSEQGGMFSVQYKESDCFAGNYVPYEQAVDYWQYRLEMLAKVSASGPLEVWCINTGSVTFKVLGVSAVDAVLRFSALKGWLESGRTPGILAWEDLIVLRESQLNESRAHIEDALRAAVEERTTF